MYVQDLEHLKKNNFINKENNPSPTYIKARINKILDDELETKDDNLDWALIDHDKDVNEDNKPVREHIHVVLNYKNPQTVKHVANLFHDNEEFVEIWKGSINNAYSYLLHETENAKDKYHYDASEVLASFNFKAKIEKIRSNVTPLSKAEIQNCISDYSNELLTKEELQSRIGILGMAKNKLIIDRITEFIAKNDHQKFVKEFQGQKCSTYWIFGKAGIGKTKITREILEELHPNNYCILGSQRDHFQEYQGQNFIVINDLRPNDYSYSQLLTLLDPYEHNKMAPSRYHDKYLNARAIFITSPYGPFEFYKECSIDNREIDSYNQLKRRVISLNLTEDTYEEAKEELIKALTFQQEIWDLNQMDRKNHDQQLNDNNQAYGEENG